eukprot:scaffold17651_cov153-Skeletonema_dohrnii-CCMP3373.AAC.1
MELLHIDRFIPYPTPKLCCVDDWTENTFGNVVAISYDRRISPVADGFIRFSVMATTYNILDGHHVDVGDVRAPPKKICRQHTYYEFLRSYLIPLFLQARLPFSFSSIQTAVTTSGAMSH